MIIPHKCPYCDYMFNDGADNEANLQYKKYEHLSKHQEFIKIINNILNKYPSINKFVKIKYDAKFNKNRNTHQFIQIVYNYKDKQYSYLLNQFETFIKIYGNYFENIEKNMISNKTLSDFFSFYSELEVMYQLEKTVNERPEVFKSNNNQNTDFILHNNQLIVEV